MIRRVLVLGGILSFSIVGALSVAHAATIAVTTLQDEDGENLTNCSLREAIKASGTKLAYGGCMAGQQYFTDNIQLKAGTYALTRGELVVSGDMEILGSFVVDVFSIDPITGTGPKRPAIETTIVATSGSRIFNSSVSNDQINLSNMILSGGTAADFGGAIRAGGSVLLNRVQINGAKANKQGGAIYLEGAQSTLTAFATSFTGNNAPSGAVLSMSCLDNLNPTARTLSLTQVSVTGNGLAGSSSILDVCGDSTATILSSTIAQNAARNTDLSGEDPAIVRISGKINSRLGQNSILGLTSNTLVENDSSVVLAYGTTRGLTLTNNIIAFNNSVLDCKYTGQNDPVTNKPPTTTASYNLFSSNDASETAANSKCQFTTVAETADTNFYSSNTSTWSDHLSPLGLYGSSDLLGYLPKITSTKIINKGESVQKCGGTDQRGLDRSAGVKLTENVSDVFRCDIGALELSTLIANNDQGGLNASYDVVVNVPVVTTGLTDSQIKKLTENNTAYLNAYKSSYRYRQVVMDVLLNDNTQEAVSGNTSTLDLLTDSTKYAVRGIDSPDGLIHCEWNPVMKQMLASRNNGSTTAGGDVDSCEYEIKDLSVGGATKTASIKFSISNIAPIAKNDALTLRFGEKSIPLNILANDSDDGDGPVGSTNYPVGKLPFYVDKRLVDGVIVSIPANIRFVTKPTQGHIVAEYQQPCPSNSVNTPETICYGGKLTYVNDNLFSPFNDSFTYEVLDSDLTPSNTATVTVTNTATTTDKEKAGGGSLGLGVLLSLVSLMLVRRRMVN